MQLLCETNNVGWLLHEHIYDVMSPPLHLSHKVTPLAMFCARPVDFLDTNVEKIPSKQCVYISSFCDSALSVMTSHA